VKPPLWLRWAPISCAARKVVQVWYVPAFEPPEQLNLFLLCRIFSGAPGAQHQRLFRCVTYYLRILVHVLG